jgi:hypothetical protein
MINADTILNSIKEAVEAKRQLNPDIWLDAAFKLNVLIGDENDVLLTRQQEVAKKKLEFLTAGDTVAAAKLKVEATDEYREMHRQKMKVAQIEEFIRISKIQARAAQGI